MAPQWETLESDLGGQPYVEAFPAIAQVVRYLGEQVTGLSSQIGDVVSRDKFDRRQEALAAAREHVQKLTEEKNSRGYDKAILVPEKRIEMELRVANFLLGER